MRRLFLMLTLLLPVTVLGSSASLAQSKLDASILSYDGKDFTRTCKKEKRRSVQNLRLIALPTKHWPKDTPTPAQ